MISMEPNYWGADGRGGATEVEWGVQYLDGKIMKRFNREAAEESVAKYPGRVLMRRVDGSPWTRVDDDLGISRTNQCVCREDGNHEHCAVHPI